MWIWLISIFFGLIVVFLVIVYLLQEKLIFFPEKVPENYQYSFSQPFKEVYLTSPDKARLHALYFIQDNPKGAILYFHGNAGSLRSWGYVAEDLMRYGYNVLIMDYQGFGKSTGKLSQKALFEDAELMYKYLLNYFPEQKLVVFGRSLGTGIAVKVAADNKPGLLLLETPFYNFADVAKAHYSFLPISLLLRYPFRSDKYLPQVSCPVYIFHGTADEIVPYASGLKLANLLNQPGGLITVEGGGHNNLEGFAVYQQALKRILE